MKKILIIDTQGAEITPAYHALLPGVSMRGVEMDATRGTPCHSHGAWCGWLSAIPVLGAGMELEVVFVRIFDANAQWVPNCESWMLDIIEEERPDCISRSWGAWDGDDRITRMFAETSFDEWIVRFAQLQDDIKFADFGAAGNNDNNDADEDVAYPQCQLEHTNVIGACRRDGVPCVWSGDGPAVQCVMWADEVFSPDMSGEFAVWSGTSAACPKAAGAYLALNDTPDSWRVRMRTLPPYNRPEGEWTLPHPKWGYGCAEDFWQNFAKRIPVGLMPMQSLTPIPYVNKNKTYHDYREESGETQEPDQMRGPAHMAAECTLVAGSDARATETRNPHGNRRAESVKAAPVSGRAKTNGDAG
ncbi:MAG: hypothetical protein EOM20_06790 [Spartobacteria bacterium]|nr:hypothetical protein [Spartobacteria bacterium]